jgi:thioredoxin-related protein
VFQKFNVQVTPTVIFTQTDKKILKRYEAPEDIGTIFDELSTEI